MKNKTVSYDELHRLFHYDPDTGLLVRRKNCQIVGTLHAEGYLTISINKKFYLVHRVVWFMHHGYWTENDIDHINRIRHDNRIENLREVSRSCNIRNSGNYKTNTSGVKGVSWSKSHQKWNAYICVNKKLSSLGFYDKIENAVIARFRAELLYGWSSCNFRSPAHKYLIENNLMYKVVPK